MLRAKTVPSEILDAWAPSGWKSVQSALVSSLRKPLLVFLARDSAQLEQFLLRTLDSKFPAVNLEYALSSKDPVSYIPCALAHGSAVGAALALSVTRDMAFGLAAGGVSFHSISDDWVDDSVHILRAMAVDNSSVMRRTFMRFAMSKSLIWADVGARLASIRDAFEVGVRATFKNSEAVDAGPIEGLSRDEALVMLATLIARRVGQQFKEFPLKLPPDVFSRRGAWTAEFGPFTKRRTNFVARIISDTVELYLDNHDYAVCDNAASILGLAIDIVRASNFQHYFDDDKFISWMFASSEAGNDPHVLITSMLESENYGFLTYPMDCAAVEWDSRTYKAERDGDVLKSSFDNGVTVSEWKDTLMTQGRLHSYGVRSCPLDRLALSVQYMLGDAMPTVACNCGQSSGWVALLSKKFADEFKWNVPTILTSGGPIFRFASRALVRPDWKVDYRYAARKLVAAVSGDSVVKAPEQGEFDAYIQWKSLGRVFSMPVTASGHASNHHMLSAAYGFPIDNQMDLRIGNVTGASDYGLLFPLVEHGHVEPNEIWHNAFEDAMGTQAALILCGKTDYPYQEVFSELSRTYVRYRSISPLAKRTSGESVPPMNPTDAANIVREILR